MNIDDLTIKSYLNGNKDYSNHWFFSVIKEEDYLFEEIDLKYKQQVKFTYEKMLKCLNNFEPYNQSLLTQLFPNWKDLIKNLNIVLVVGSPKPLDAMALEYQGNQYLIFDIFQFSEYDNEKIDSIILGIVTHEFIHACIHYDYPSVSVESSYKDKLKYMIFNEGFAHLLSFNKDIQSFDFTETIKTHFERNYKKLKTAFNVTNIDTQKELLKEAVTGYYWDKFAAISGMLFLASNLNLLNDIYKNGIDKMISDMGL